MQLRSLQLQNLGRFYNLEIDFAPTPQKPSKVTLLIGNNGSGKTSILRALATNLSWLAARIRSEKASGSAFPEEVVANSSSSSLASIKVCDSLGVEFQWSIAKTQRGRKAQFSSNYSGATQLARQYREQLTEQPEASLPLIVFYPVERVVLDVPLKIRQKHNFYQLDGYDNALNQGVDFRRFFEWFREREDIENEMGASFQQLGKLEVIKQQLADKPEALQAILQILNTGKDKQLEAVRSAISQFIPEFSNLRVQRKPRLHMAVDKNGETLNVLQLSQGEKSLMALVGDIARRLAMMNPSLENPLEGKGVVLIDEVDMHLHPQWQRGIIDRLTSTFPNCQFVLTTHSPLVISDSKGILVYELNNSEIHRLPSQYGQDANKVLSLMDTPSRNAILDTKLKDLFDLIQEQSFQKAKALLAAIEQDLNEDEAEPNAELAKAKVLLRAMERRLEKD